MIGRTYEFETELDLQIVGTYRYHAIKIPVGTQAEIEFGKGVKRRFVVKAHAVGAAARLRQLGLDDPLDVVVEGRSPARTVVAIEVIRPVPERHGVLDGWRRFLASSWSERPV